MKDLSKFRVGVVGAMLAASPMMAFADNAQHPMQGGESADNPSLTSVGPVTGRITALNYDPDGRTVNGLFIGASNTMLTFERPVCGGLGSLGKVDDSVTYSGSELSFSSGFNSVRVTSYTDGSITYSHAAPAPAPTRYALTAGKIKALNYDPRDGAINGFFFAPTTGPEVFVDIGHVDSMVAGLLAGAAPVALSVTGVELAPPLCAKTASTGIVVASSLTIGGAVYPLGGHR
jgi:hypothetical protein